MLPISVCIIAKNEEKYLGGCLEHLKDYDWEIVVVDTGSTDNTVEIAKKYTNSVYHFEWCDDFSRAKNFAAKKAKNDIIVSLDADEYLKEIDTDEILALLHEYPYGMGDFIMENLVGSKESVGKSYSSVTRVYNRKYVHYEGRIHEQLRRLDGEKRATAKLHMSAVHYGYLLTPEESRLKDERNIALLGLDLIDNPNNPYTYFQLGQSYASMGDKDKTYEVRAKAMELNPAMDAPYTEHLIVDYGRSALDTGHYDEALALERLMDDMKEVADYLFILGQAHFATGDKAGAVELFTRATDAPRVFVQGMNSYFPLNAMSVVLENMGENELAKECANRAQSLLAEAARQFELEVGEV